MRTCAIGLVCAAVCATWTGLASAEDWPQWRGPNFTGVTSGDDFQADFLVDGQPKVAWSKEVGTGYAPVTVKDGLALTSGWKDGKDTIYCFDADTGELKWTYSYASELFDKQHAGGPSDAIALDDERAYHFTRDARLMCLDTDTGELLWERDIAGDYNIKAPRWMYAGSPIVVDETLYLDAGHILALNPADGKEKWKTANFGAAYSTPTPFELHGRKMLAAFPESGLVVVDRQSGQVLAQHKWTTEYGVNAATPVVVGDKIFISSGYNTGCALLQLTNAGLKLLWENRNMRNQLPTSVVIGDYIYGFDAKQLKCIALADGREQWAVPTRDSGREYDFGQGALIAHDDTLIILSDSGELVTATASPDGFTPIARAKVLDAANIWVMPTLADGNIYCRSPQGKVVCIDTDRD